MVGFLEGGPQHALIKANGAIARQTCEVLDLRELPAARCTNEPPCKLRVLDGHGRARGRASGGKEEAGLHEGVADLHLHLLMSSKSLQTPGMN